MSKMLWTIIATTKIIIIDAQLQDLLFIKALFLIDY